MPREKDHIRARVDQAQRLLREPNARVRLIMGVLHPTEIAQILEEASHDLQERIVRELPRDLISEALAEMDEESNPGRLLTLLRPDLAAELVSELEMDDAADLLADLSEANRAPILERIPDEEEAVITQLLTYDEDTAGGIMNPELVYVEEEMTKLDALRSVVKQAEEIEDFYIIYVVDSEQHLTGYLRFRSLFTSRNADLVKDIMETDVVSVTVDQDQEEVAKIMSQYNLPTLPVIDIGKRLVGRITFDDVMDVMEEENTEDILSFAGVSEGEGLRSGWAEAVRSRIPWLMINLVTASIASLVISQFDETISRIVVLASMMPIIAGVGGNGAIQTLAVTIRRISTDGIPRRIALRVISKEIFVGAINGLMIGALVSVLVAVTRETPSPQYQAMLGLVVFLSMTGNLLLGGLAGSFIPITLERLGVDPAVASSILITAFTDIMGYILLFSLGTYFLLPLVSNLRDGGLMLILP